MKHVSSGRGLVSTGAFLLAAALATGDAPGALALDLDGFVKNFFVVDKLPTYEVDPTGPPPPGSSTMVANNLRVRINADARPTDWMAVDVSYNFVPRWQNDEAALFLEGAIASPPPTYRVDDLNPALVPRDPAGGDNWLALQNLDRAYVSLSAPRFDLYVGRQAIAWGSARGINPTDVVAPFLITEIDTEDRIGVDAARLRVPVAALGEVVAGDLAGCEFSANRRAVFVRGKFYALQSDAVVIAMRFRRHAMIGVDVARALGGAGFWVEAANVWLDDDVVTRSPVSGTEYETLRYARVSVGLDYSLANATYVFVEYHYNEAGWGEASGYRFVAASPAYTDGNVYLLGRHYLIPAVTFPATPLLSLALNSLVNLGDGSVLLAPYAEYSVTDNVYASVGAFAGFGSVPVFDPPATAPASGSSLIGGSESTRFRSEFGAYPDTFFASLRYYF